MQIDGHTKLIGYFGSSFKESKVYSIYNSTFQALNLNYVFVPFVVNDLAKAVEGVRELGITAFGVTIPFKKEIIEHLDDLSAVAKRVGAVNVVVNKGGCLVGDNTDGAGALQALKECTEVRDKKVCLLGAGGAARAIAYSLQDEGGKVILINEEDHIAEYLVKDLGGEAEFRCFEQRDNILADCDIVINATPVGMSGTTMEGKSLVSKDCLHSNMTVMDVIATPRQTRLLQDASSAGCNIVYGDRMLLWQAYYKFKIYTGFDTDFRIMETAFMESNN